MINLEPGSHLSKVLMKGKRQVFPKKHQIAMSDDRIMVGIIKSGYVKRYMISSDGKLSVQSVYGPGEVFPLTPVYRAIFNKNIYFGDETFYYETITPTNMYTLNKNELLEELSKDPMLYKDILAVSGKRLHSNIHKLENMSLRATNKRVAHMLLYLAGVFGEKTDEGIIINLPLTHELISDMLDVARETVSLKLTSLAEKGVIRTSKNIVVLDLEKLKSLSC